MCFSAALVSSCLWEPLNSLLYRYKPRTKQRWEDTHRPSSTHLSVVSLPQLLPQCCVLIRLFPPPCPAAASADHRPLVALSHPVDQLQSKPAAAEQQRHGRLPAEQHDRQQRASSTGPGHLLQGETCLVMCPSRSLALIGSFIFLSL